jgi:hypothetical protein
VRLRSERLKAEEDGVSEVLKQQGYYELPETRRLITSCRQDIVSARIRLATDRALNREQRDALWNLIDSNECFLRMVAENYTAELEKVDRELEAKLTKLNQ